MKEPWIIKSNDICPLGAIPYHQFIRDMAERIDIRLIDTPDNNDDLFWWIGC